MGVLEKELSRVGGIKICPSVIITKDDKVLMGYRHYTPDKWKNISVWTIPGGRCDKGETIENTLRREVMEETGISDLQILGYIEEVPGAKEGDSVPLFYGKTEQEFKLMEPEKFSEWRWVKISDYLAGAPGNFINGEAHKIITLYFQEMLGINPNA